MGGDRKQSVNVIWEKYFNSRPRVGGDSYGEFFDTDLTIISIHAPAWGATRDAGLTTLASDISIHAPAWGATKRLQTVLAGK